jgi:transketolase
MREDFGEVLAREMAKDERIWALAAVTGFYASSIISERFAGRFLNMGIAEQNAVGVAAGLALAGDYPVLYGFGTFLLRRGYEVLRLQFGENQLPGLIVGFGRGKRYDFLGPCHVPDDAPALAKAAKLTYMSPPQGGLSKYVPRAIRLNKPVLMEID